MHLLPQGEYKVIVHPTGIVAYHNADTGRTEFDHGKNYCLTFAANLSPEQITKINTVLGVVAQTEASPAKL